MVEKSPLFGTLFYLSPNDTLLGCSRGLEEALELLKPKLSLHMSVILHCHICSKTDLQGFPRRAAVYFAQPHLPAFGR